MTCGAAATYVLAPSYLSVYTENYAIALAVLGVGLLFRFPALSGAAFALSSSVKISGVILWALVLIIDSVLKMGGDRAWPSVRKSPPFRSLVGFGGTALGIILMAQAQGYLSGWLDIVKYNGEYAALMRAGMPPLLDVNAFVKFAWPGTPTAAFMGLLLAALIGVFLDMAATLSLRGLAVGAHPVRSQIDDRMRPVAVVSALFVASGIALLLQFPPRFQHYQYVVGPGVLAGSVWLAILWKRDFALHRRVSAALLTLALLPMIAGFVLATPANGTFSALSRWDSLNGSGVELVALQRVPQQSSLAFFGVDSSILIDPRSIPAGSELRCRFYYQFDHILVRYQAEILSCLETNPDYVIVRRESDFDRLAVATTRLSADIELGFRDAMLQELSSNFTRCSTEDVVFDLWSHKPNGCPGDISGSS